MSHVAAGWRLELRDVTKVFQRDQLEVHALGPLDLRVADGEFLSIIGPSGCGKSTLLDMVAGLGQLTSGEIWFDGSPAPSRLGRAAYVHQRDLLLPWRTVFENAILPLEAKRVPRREAMARAVP